jgi:hypothetical protein
LVVTVATIALGIWANNNVPSRAPDAFSSAKHMGGSAAAPSQPLDRNRDFISQREANLLAARKLVPSNVQSLLKVPAVMRHGDFTWNDAGVAKGDVRIWVDLRRQMISAFRNGHEIGTAVIVYGAENMSSPEGRFPILNKQRHYHSRTYDAPMPASLFITNDGVALHGSPMSSRRASHGCIGLPVKFAEKLFDASEVGDIVEIARSQMLPEDSSVNIS